MKLKKSICVLIAICFFIPILSAQEQDDKTFLFKAIKDGNYELFTYYIEKKGLGVNCPLSVDTSPFGTFVDTNDILTPLTYLFFLRPQLNGREDISWNYKGELLADVYERMLDYLIKNGADVNCKSEKGYTCIEYFYNQGYDLYIHGELEWVKKVYMAGFDFSKSKNLGWQILRNCEIKVFEYVYNKGVDFSITLTLDDMQNFKVHDINLLQYAIYMYIYTGRWEFIKKLLDTRQIDINSKDSNGDTALHYAVYLNYPHRVVDSYECLEWVKFLVKNGANPMIRNNNGLTPFDTAVKHGRNGCASYLLQFE